VKHLLEADFQALLLVQTESVYLISNNSWTTLVGTHVAFFGSSKLWRGVPPAARNEFPFFCVRANTNVPTKIMDLFSTHCTYVGTILYKCRLAPFRAHFVGSLVIFCGCCTVTTSALLCVHPFFIISNIMSCSRSCISLGRHPDETCCSCKRWRTEGVKVRKSRWNAGAFRFKCDHGPHTEEFYQRLGVMIQSMMVVVNGAAMRLLFKQHPREGRLLNTRRRNLTNSRLF
jgi:hypothetical protein